MGGGLGGGSADAAFTLKLLNEKFSLGLSTEQLINYALQIGSDCPFFIINKPAYATGRGEMLEQLHLDLSAYKFIIVNPGITVSTSRAFTRITPSLPQQIIERNNSTTHRQPGSMELINDFEKSIFTQYSEIEAIKNKLYDNGALYASMSGSGSTVYGIYEKEINVRY